MSSTLEPADTDLLVGLTRGDAQAATTLWNRHASDVLAFARAVLGGRGDAEDALQEVFFSLLRLAPARAAEVRNVRSLLLTSARNVCLNRLVEARRRAGREHRAARAEPALGVGPDTELASALHRLPRRVREAVVLRSVLGLSTDEAARACGVSRSALAERHARGLAMLREQLGCEEKGAVEQATPAGVAGGRVP